MNGKGPERFTARIWLITSAAAIVIVALLGFVASLTAGLGWRLIVWLF